MFDIKALANMICAGSEDLAGLNTTIEKELLHYEVIAAMSKHGFLQDLTFQGGTCLRMMYGANRLSEDLDFAGGEGFDFDKLTRLKATLQEELSQRHNLRLNISEPNMERLNAQKDIQVGRWKISIETEPQQKSAPWQKVKLEVATVKAHTQTLRPMVKSYADIPDAYTSVLINCEALEEIAADKVVALALRRSIKARDLWDLTWLTQRKIEPELALVKNKFEDYQYPEGLALLDKRLQAIPAYMASGEFEAEMSRFLHSSVKSKTLGHPEFVQYVQTTVIDMGQRLLDESNTPRFPM